VELLVVIAIIGVLVALLLPAVQAAREAARRSSCTNNMRQVALALLLHHDAKRAFPHGTYNYITDDTATPAPYKGRQNRRCWMHDMLPYMEQQALYERFDTFMKTHTQAYDFPECHTQIEALMCPSDPTNPKVVTFSNSTAGVTGPPPAYDGQGASQGFHGNYITCSGEQYFNPYGPGLTRPYSSAQLDGLFFAVSKIRSKDITDGASHTAMVSELILSPDSEDDDVRGRYYNPIEGNVNFTTLYPPNSPSADRVNWLTKTPVPEAPAMACTTCFFNTDSYLTVRSYHVGGVNLAAADGSVHFIPNEIDYLVFRGFGTRAGVSIRGSVTNEIGDMP